MYSISAQTPENTVVPFTLTFYKEKNGQNVVCYEKETFVIAKSAKKVEFEVYNAQKVDISTKEFEQGIDQAYNVTRGKTYALETTIVGFKMEETHFKANNCCF